MIISRTPFRISFFGGGTDFPEYYREHGGAVLCTTIDKYCYLLVHRLGPFFKYKYRANYAETESVQHPSEFQHPLVRECMALQEMDCGLEIAHVADLPGRTGLGSSSSFSVGLLNALHAFLEKEATPEELASQAIQVERERVGDPGGHQDQYAVAHGGLRHIRFGPGESVRVDAVNMPEPRLLALESSLLLFYTGVEKSADAILSEQARSLHEKLEVLGEMKSLVDRGAAILQGDEDLDRFGDLLHETWVRKKTLASGISNKDIDRAYETARGSGALGGKLLGAGGRGFLLLYVPLSRQTSVRESLTTFQEVGFRFSNRGSEIILASPDSI
jgi:D-glycero-alpha-D-manno-heptose-7-phosphate kinase